MWYSQINVMICSNPPQNLAACQPVDRVCTPSPNYPLLFLRTTINASGKRRAIDEERESRRHGDTRKATRAGTQLDPYTQVLGFRAASKNSASGEPDSGT